MTLDRRTSNQSQRGNDAEVTAVTQPEQPIGTFETFLSRIHSPTLLTVATQWDKARKQNRMPTWEDLPLSIRSTDAKHIWGFAFNPTSREFTGRLAGNRVSKWVDESFYGGRLADVHAAVNYEECRQLLTKVVKTPLAGRTSGRLFASDDYVVTGERIVLPLAADGETGNGILGASDYVPPPLLGQLTMFHENVEWYTI